MWESKEGDLIASWRINREISELPSPGLLQISIGASVSSLINCDLKWPNDLVSATGKKIGGILIEANSSERGFRLGISWKLFDFNQHGNKKIAIIRTMLEDASEACDKVNSIEGLSTTTTSGKIRLVRERLSQ